MPAYHPSGYPPGGRGMHGLLAGEAHLLRVQRLAVPPPRPKDLQHHLCSQPFPNVELASLYLSYLGPVPMQARLGACLRQALHGQDWALWKQRRPALLSQSRNDSTVSRRRGHHCRLRPPSLGLSDPLATQRLPTGACYLPCQLVPWRHTR